MKCPVCKKVKLLMLDKSGIIIDYCPDCRWIWLDKGKLEKILENWTGNMSKSNTLDKIKKSDEIKKIESIVTDNGAKLKNGISDVYNGIKSLYKKNI